MSEEETPIVFFDGVCGLCNTSVDFFMRADRRGKLRFAPLQGETAEQMLNEADREDLKSLVSHSAQNSFRRSAGVVRILWQIGGIWKLAGTLLWLIPLPLRDLGYNLVAASRYKLFGQKSTCRMPTPAERGRILT